MFIIPLFVDGLTYFKDLMEESSLPSSLSMLEKDYDYMIHNKSELDERLFINEDDSLLASVSLSGGSVSAGGVKVCSIGNLFKNFVLSCVR